LLLNVVELEEQLSRLFKIASHRNAILLLDLIEDAWLLGLLRLALSAVP